MTEMIVRIGDWEHECCGEAVEVSQIVEFGCLTLQRASGEECLVETHHDREPDVYVRGCVSEKSVVDGKGAQRSTVRVPSGLALRGFDPRDDGHLEEQCTSLVVGANPAVFDVMVIANEISEEPS
jgi:hypothetical protein